MPALSFGMGMVAAGLSCLCVGSVTAQMVVDSPRTTSVDYPHIRLSSNESQRRLVTRFRSCSPAVHRCVQTRKHRHG